MPDPISLITTARLAGRIVLAGASVMFKYYRSLDGGKDNELCNALADLGLNMGAGVVTTPLEQLLTKDTAAANAFVNDHLARFTGHVLQRLVQVFIQERPQRLPDKQHAADSKTLAAFARNVPQAWLDFLRTEQASTAQLSGQRFVQLLGLQLKSPETQPTLKPADFFKFFKRVGPLPGGIETELEHWLRKSLPHALATLLVSDDTLAKPAYRKTILRFHAEHLAYLRQIDKKLDGVQDTLNKHLIPATEAARLTAYKRAIVTAFHSYQELALDNYATAEQTAPDIWDIFVHPACAMDYLTPEAMDIAQRETPPRLPAQDLLPILGSDTDRRHVLLADPGMGKSTLIQSLLALIASGRPVPEAKALIGLLPVPLILRDLVPLLPQDKPQTWDWHRLVDALLQHYRREENAPLLLEAYHGHEEEFRRLLHGSESVFFLVDGLDEIGDHDKRRHLVRAVQEGIRTADKGARWLITSRVIGYKEAEVDVVDVIKGLYLDPVRSREPRSDVAIRDYVPAIRRRLEEWSELLLDGINNPNLQRTLAKLEEDALPLNRMDEPFVDNLGAHMMFFIPIARRLYLAPFDNKRQDAFTHRWFTHRHSTDHSTALMREVRSHGHDGVRIISRVPNLLCMMNMLKRSGKPLPDGRHALYDEIVKAYLGGIDAAYQLKPIHGHTCPIDTPERRHLLALLGAHMQQIRTAATKIKTDGNILIARPELEALLGPAIDSLRQTGKVKSDHSTQELLDELLRHIASRSGLLIPRSTDAEGNAVYGFTHLSFLEFFAAEWLGKEFDRLRNRLARHAEAAADGLEITEADLDRDFPPLGPIQHQRANFPALAASPAWQEPLIFLVEARKSDTATLLRWLFPALHATQPYTIPEDEDKAVPLMPLDAVNLAVKLAQDQELALPLATRQHWWRTLWRAHLLWPHGPYEYPESKRWHIAPLLLQRQGWQEEVLSCLADQHLQHHDRPLCLQDCVGLSDLTPLKDLASLQRLYLVGCTWLSDLTPLKDLASLTTLGLNGCTGLSDLTPLKDLASLRTLCLNGCTGLGDLTPLKDLASLRSLDLRECTGLSDLTPLKDLASLQSLSLNGCTGVSGTTVEGLHQKLLKCSIYEP